MTSNHWLAVRDLFEQAIDQPPESLDAWLAAQAADRAIVDEVRALLATHARAGAFLDAPLTTRVPDLLEDDARFEAGATVGPYVIQREVGRGGMGRVYLATDSRLARQVALKVLAPHLVRDESQRERLRREARAAAALSHPGICTVYELEEFAHEVVIATEFVDGETLRAEIDRDVRPAAADVTALARTLASTLEAAHARGITHRDLKPENVMRRRDGTVKVLDFGLALVDGQASGSTDSPRVTTPGMLVGTPAYMAPEQLDSGPVGPATDLFALGVVLYEYATGVHPFASGTPLALAARILEGAHQPLGERRPDLPAALVSAIERCLRKRPEDRFDSAGALLRALDGPGSSSASTTAPRSAAVGWWRTHQQIVLGLYLVVIGASWVAREWGQGLVDTLFLVVAPLAVIAGVYRSHLLFADTVLDRAPFERARRRAALPLTLVDLLLGLALAVQGVATTDAHPVPGVLIVGLAAGVVLARLVLERSTAEAAFGDE